VSNVGNTQGENLQSSRLKNPIEVGIDDLCITSECKKKNTSLSGRAFPQKEEEKQSPLRQKTSERGCLLDNRRRIRMKKYARKHVGGEAALNEIPGCTAVSSGTFKFPDAQIKSSGVPSNWETTVT